MEGVSVKTKMALTVSLVFILFFAICSYVTLSFFERTFTETISAQQFTLTSALASSIDNKIRMAQTALVGASAKVTPKTTGNREAAAFFLDDRPTLMALFDDGIFLLTPEGELIAECSEHRHTRHSGPHSFRDFARATRTTGKPFISNYYTSHHNNGHPAIFMTVPLTDSRGNIFAIMGGSIDLYGANILEEVSSIRIGSTGYVYICDRDRTIIVHPDKKMLLSRRPAGKNIFLDKAVRGFEGTGVTENFAGVPMLASFKKLSVNDWIVTTNLPLNEAYAPLRTAEGYVIAGSIGGTVLLLLLVWFLMDRCSSPLLFMARHVMALAEKKGEQRLIALKAGGEIGTLANAFNEMVMKLDCQQAALLESENNFRALAETASDGMIVIASDGRFVYANYSVAKMSGYSISEIRECRLTDIVPLPELNNACDNFHRIVNQGDVPDRQESLLKLKNGEVIPVEMTNSMTFWKGEPADLLIIRNISERKRAEKELQNALRHLENEKAHVESILAGIGEAITIIDRDYRIIYQNGTQIEMLGHHVGEYCFKAYEKRSEQCLHCPTTMVFNDGLIHTIEKRLCANDAEIDLEVTASPLKEASGEIVAVIELIKDISQRKQAEKRIFHLNSDLQRRASELAALNQELESFSYSVSHDLKGHLTSIYAAGQGLRESSYSLLNDSGRFFVKTICLASERLDELLDAMLLLSRVMRSEMRLERVSLTGLADEILQRWHQEQPERLVTWVVAQDMEVSCDPRLLKSAMENLIGNAWKYTRKTQQAFIEIGRLEHTQGTVFFIRDNGAGFDPASCEEIFRPFRRLHENEFEGTGVGLATVDRIMKRHGGRIWAESRPGMGATFYFTLPGNKTSTAERSPGGMALAVGSKACVARGPGKRNDVPDIFHPRQVHDEPFEAETKTGMGG